jgi:hypothetical protein
MIDITCAVQIPEVIYTILKSAQKIETMALNLLNHSNMKIMHQKSDVMAVFDVCSATGIQNFINTFL